VTTFDTEIKALNDRWHDQSLNLKTIKFDESKGRLNFEISVEEVRPEVLFNVFIIVLKKIQLKKCVVKLKNVIAYSVNAEKGESEIFCNEIQRAGEKIVIKGDNGTLFIKGNNIDFQCDEKWNGDYKMSLFVMFFEWDWIKRTRNILRNNGNS
jgi:hypothetical protein